MQMDRLIWIVWFAAALVFAWSLTGCKCPECAIAGSDNETIITVHTRDTAIITLPDTATVQLLLHCDSANNVLIDEINTANGERLQLQLQLQALANGAVAATVDCKTDSLEQIIQLQDSIIKSTTTNTIVRIEKQRDFVYWCGWVLIGIVCIGFLIGLLLLIIKIAK